MQGSWLVASHAGTENALWVVDISDPRHPQHVATYNTVGQPFRLTAEGNELFVADSEAGIQPLDMSHPTAPLFAGEADTPGLAHEIAATEQLLLVADGGGGLLLFDRGALRNGAAAALPPTVLSAESRNSSLAPALLRQNRDRMAVPSVCEPGGMNLPLASGAPGQPVKPASSPRQPTPEAAAYGSAFKRRPRALRSHSLRPPFRRMRPRPFASRAICRPWCRGASRSTQAKPG